MSKRKPATFRNSLYEHPAKRAKNLLTCLDENHVSLFSSSDTGPSIECLPDDVVSLIMVSLSASSSSISDVLSLSMTSKRMRFITTRSSNAILRSASMAALTIPASKWSPAAHKFLRSAARARNMEAAFLLGMIEFYCLKNESEGLKLLVMAASQGHASSLHSLSIIQFNGSGITAQNLKAAVLLAASAAQKGHVAAMRELGHCLQDGYGVEPNVNEGKRLLLEANFRELTEHMRENLSRHQLAAIVASLELVRSFPRVQTTAEAPILEQSVHGENERTPSVSTGPSEMQRVPPMTPRTPSAVEHKDLASPTNSLSANCHHEDGGRNPHDESASCSSVEFEEHRRKIAPDLLKSFSDKFGHLLEGGWSQFLPKCHPANQFMVDWYSKGGKLGDNLKLCGNEFCGRSESRAHEFRCCSTCSGPSYCSRDCQAFDWKFKHMQSCHQEAEADIVEGNDSSVGDMVNVQVAVQIP